MSKNKFHDPTEDEQAPAPTPPPAGGGKQIDEDADFLLRAITSVPDDGTNRKWEFKDALERLASLARAAALQQPAPSSVVAAAETGEIDKSMAMIRSYISISPSIEHHQAFEQVTKSIRSLCSRLDDAERVMKKLSKSNNISLYERQELVAALAAVPTKETT